VRFAFTEEQEALRAAARAFLRDHSSPARVRRAMATEAGWEPEVWRRIAGELAWTAILVPERYGGLGLTYVELVALMEEMGAALLCAPFFSTVCLAGNALLLGGTEAQKQEHLPKIATGERTAALAHVGPAGRWDADGVEVVAERAGDGYRLGGVSSFVVDGHTADLLVVAARRPGSRGTEGVSLFAVPATLPGIERRLLPTMDLTRKLAEVRFAGVAVPRAALMGEEGEGWDLLSRTLDLAAIALAAEQVGGAQRCLDLAAEYAKQRVQFGRPIGSFQAIQHKCSDMLVRVESARSAAYYAGWAAAVGEAEVPLLASLVKAYCSEAYFFCAAEAIQIHGGVGFTWEYDVHLYFKRARACEALLGSPSFHRERIARAIGLGAAAGEETR
jgi:alkylation response protein AidB-like acyl-CoA dehydrogenase